MNGISRRFVCPFVMAALTVSVVACGEHQDPDEGGADVLDLSRSSTLRISCEMTSTENPEKKTSATIKTIDRTGYGFAESDSGIDNKYWFTAETYDLKSTSQGTVSVVIADDNDEVGSFECDLRRKKSSKVICVEPILLENGIHKYDITCRFL
jgi:hypothetical protein